MSDDRIEGRVAVADDAVSATTHEAVEGFLKLLPNNLLAAIEAHGGDELTWAFPVSLTGGKVWEGKATVMRRLARVLDNFEDGSMKISRRVTIVSGSEASAEFDLTARSAKGAAYANTYVFFFSCRGDRIVSVREYMDTQVVAELMR